jgi:hypothetical protein
MPAGKRISAVVCEVNRIYLRARTAREPESFEWIGGLGNSTDYKMAEFSRCADATAIYARQVTRNHRALLAQSSDTEIIGSGSFRTRHIMKTALLSHGTARFFFTSSTRRFRQAIGLAALLAGVGLANSVQALTTNCVPAPDGAVAWWRAETNAIDSVAGHDGVLSGGADFTAGQVGAAFWFDGLDDGVLVADAADLNVGPGQDFTIEAWIQAEPHATDFGVMSILSKRVAPNLINAQGYELALHYGKLGGQLADARQQHNNFISAGPDLLDGAYHHVAMSVHRAATNGGKLFVDGQEVLTFDPTIQPGDLTTTAPLRIGKHASDWFNGSFKGRVDEAAFMLRALRANAPAVIRRRSNVSIYPADWWVGGAERVMGRMP